MLELKNISFGVNGEGAEKEIIRDVSLTVPDGKLVVITGPNGGGKSTLARLIAGIEKPSSGRIYLDGEDITDMSVTDRAKRGIGYAFQQPVRFKGLQVIDLIRIATGRKISVADACEYLSAVGLCARDYVDREVNSSLSGGELKRIEIATVMARDGLTPSDLERCIKKPKGIKFLPPETPGQRVVYLKDMVLLMMCM